LATSSHLTWDLASYASNSLNRNSGVQASALVGEYLGVLVFGVACDLAFFDGVSGDGGLESEVLESGSGLMVRFLDMVGLDVMVFSLGLWFVRRMRETRRWAKVSVQPLHTPSQSFDSHAYSVVKARYCFWSSRRTYKMDALSSVGSNVLAGVVPEYQLTGSSTCSPHSVHHQHYFLSRCVSYL
jgi:hypothetical protein